MVQKADASVKTRGRPRAFDAAAALLAMREVFWNKGYAATSLDDLCETAGLNRPSLYNAFGDKAQVFKAVLDDYISEVKPLYTKAFLSEGSTRDVLLRVYDTAFDIYLVHTRGLGCFMIGAALTDSMRDAEIARMILARLRELDKGFIYLMQRAHERGDLRPGVTAEGAAIVCAAIHNSISVRMRAGETLEDLKRYVATAIATVCV